MGVEFHVKRETAAKSRKTYCLVGFFGVLMRTIAAQNPAEK